MFSLCTSKPDTVYIIDAYLIKVGLMKLATENGEENISYTSSNRAH